jgi:hypothetical protein
MAGLIFGQFDLESVIRVIFFQFLLMCSDFISYLWRICDPFFLNLRSAILFS